MCGRWSLIADDQALLMRFGAAIPKIQRKPRYNIAPMQDALIIRNEAQNEFSLARWGLVPHWAKDEQMAYNTINARADSIADKPAYREPFKSKRCLIPADGFYEWKDTPQGKTPYRFTLKDNSLFSFAGLYDTWFHDNKTLTTFTIITVEPNSLVKQIHTRMPAILTKEDERSWLDGKEPEELLKILRPYPPGDMAMTRLTSKINDAKHEGAELIAPYVENPGLGKYL